MPEYVASRHAGDLVGGGNERIEIGAAGIDAADRAGAAKRREGVYHASSVDGGVCKYAAAQVGDDEAAAATADHTAAAGEKNRSSRIARGADGRAEAEVG